MIRSLLWKDAREHIATVLTLCLGGIGLMIGIGALMALEPGNTPMRTAQATGACILFLAPGIALLLGALFFGSDKENGVSGWLDSLPEPAWKLWLARNSFATIAQLGLVVAWGIFWLVVYAPREKLLEPAMVVFLLVSSLMGVAWGQWGMQRSKTVFGGFGNGLLGFVGAGILVGICGAILGSLTQAAGREFLSQQVIIVILEFYLICGLVILTAFPLGMVFINISRQFGLPNASKNSFFRVSSRILWVSIQSLTRPFLIMGAIGLALGFMLPESFLIWPIWSLSAGVVCGLSVLSQDQGGPGQLHGSLRAFRPLLLDIRALPVFVLGLLLNLVPLLPLGVAAIFRGIVQHGPDHHLAELFWPGIGQFIPVGPYLILWWCAGFGTALWCSFFLEKSVVAFVVSWGLGAIVSSVWVPALLGGGLSVFWVFGLVAVFWILGRYLYRGFVSLNLAQAGPQSFALMVACVGLFCGLGILGRMYPARGESRDPYSVDEITRELKNPNPQLEDEVRRHLVDSRNPGVMPAQFQFLPESAVFLLKEPISLWSEKVKQFLAVGAPQGSKELAGEWKVPGEIISLFGPNQADRIQSGNHFWLNDGMRISQQMQTRGIVVLWEVSRGTKGAEQKFADEIDRMLYVGESLRHKSPYIYHSAGVELERFAYLVIDYHLSHNKPTEPGLVALSKVLEKVETRTTQVKTMTREVGFWCSRKSGETRSLWRKNSLQMPSMDGKPWLDAYWELVDFALSAPWEKERARKLVNHWFSANPPTDRFGAREVYELDLDLIPFWYLNTWTGPGLARGPEYQDQMTRAIHDLAKTAVALKRFRIAKGAWPKALSELAPAYLKEVPKDPYSQGDFGFRIFEAVKPPKVAPDKTGADGRSGEGGGDNPPGEALAGMGSGGAEGMAVLQDSLRLPNSLEMEIPITPGTLILWSVGPDKMEQGALISETSSQPTGRLGHSSFVFLVAP